MPGSPPPFDHGNPLLGPSPTVLTTAVVRGPDGAEWAVVTIRTPSTTVTAYLAKHEAQGWADQIAETAGKISGLVVANGHTGGPPPGV